MKYLVIVESPAKVKTIKKYLGKGYDAIASVGHIRDLPKSDKDAIDIESGFTPRYVISTGKEKVIDQMQEKVAGVDEVLLATDPDREGEAIAWHLKEVLDLKKPKRIVFNEITKVAVDEAIKHPRKIDMALLRSQEARRVLDRLFGYTLSKLIWLKVRYGLSAGRVQSPALRILMEREREIRVFKPKIYWEMTALFKLGDGSEYIAGCAVNFDDEKETNSVLSKMKKAAWSVSLIKKSTQTRKPRAPFITSTLQQAANNELGWSPSQTMRIAQKLYENGQITYMRTDSTTLSNTAHKDIKKKITEEYGASNYKKTIYKTRSKSAQEAHEAVRPSNVANPFGGTTPEEKKLYGLIYRRTLASQMIPAEIERTVVTFSADGLPSFLLRGAVVKESGWFLVDEEAKTQEIKLPTFKKGDSVICIEGTSIKKETSPPPRYSEAGLVKELEERGIGRPSTYAPTIRTLTERGYVEKQQRSLVPTKLGEVVNKFVEDNFTKYINDSFTSNMESDLDSIEQGEKEYASVLEAFFTPFKKDVDDKKDIPKLTTLGSAPKKIKCPKCSSTMQYKLSKTGVFMSCKKFPDCLGSRTEEGEIIKEPEPIGKECPKCGEPLVRRTGRFGDFISCGGYPKCKYIEEDPEEQKRKDTGVKCSLCKKGSIIERNGRFGPFYGCAEYPKCKFTMKARPTGKKCKECSALMMEGTKTIPERCSDKTCPQHNPHKL